MDSYHEVFFSGCFFCLQSFSFFLPSPCDLGLVTSISQNKTTGVRRRNKLVMMFS